MPMVKFEPKSYVWFTVCLLAVFRPDLAKADFFDGSAMNDFCGKKPLVVMGYVGGLIDKSREDFGSALAIYLNTLDPAISGTPAEQPFDEKRQKFSAEIQAYCSPSGIRLSQVSDLFCQYLASNPSDRHLPAHVLFNRALSKVWPC